MSEQIQKGWLHTREGDKFAPATLVENVFTRSGVPYDEQVRKYFASLNSENTTQIVDLKAELNSQAGDILTLQQLVSDNHNEILDRLANFQDTDDGTLWISDTSGNIIAFIDSEGLHTIDVEIQSGMTMSQLETDVASLKIENTDQQSELDNIAKYFNHDEYTKALYIIDNSNNVVAYIDDAGVHSINFHVPDARDYITLNKELTQAQTDIINLQEEDETLHTLIESEQTKRVDNEARITELERKTEYQDSDSDDTVLYIVDKYDQVVAYVDEEGIHAINVYSGSNNVNTELENLRQDATDLHQAILDEAAARQAQDEALKIEITDNAAAITAIKNVFGFDNEDALFINDKDSNVIAYFDATGLNVIDVTIGDKDSKKYKLYTIITDLLADDINIHEQLDKHENRIDSLETWQPEEIAAREEVAAHLSKVTNFYVSQDKAPKNNGDLALDTSGNLTIWNGLTNDWEDFIGLSRQLKEKTQYFDGSSSDSFYIIDSVGKVVAYFDASGFHTTEVFVGGLDDDVVYEVHDKLTDLSDRLESEISRSSTQDTDHNARLQSVEKQVHALGNIMQFVGAVDTVPTDVSSYQNGDVIVETSSGKEYVLSDGVWVELGDTSAELEAIQRLQKIVGDPGTIEFTHEDRIDKLEIDLADESSKREEEDSAINETLSSLQNNVNWTDDDSKLFIIDSSQNVIAYFDDQGLTVYNAIIDNKLYKKDLQANGIYFSDTEGVTLNWLA